MSFFRTLESKGKEYAPFDPKRFPQIFKKVQQKKRRAFTIQILGTNGKGTTGRFIAEYLFSKGKKTAHFTSPHIAKINERFWRDGEFLSDEELENIHQEIAQDLELLDLEALSYFEYLTLAAFYGFKECDYFIVEAGLGGEFDSTTSLDIDFQVVTKIGLDHKEFLGESVKEIATTKLAAIKTKSVIALQEYDEICSLAKNKESIFLKDRGLDLKKFQKEEEPLFLGENRATAFSVLKELGFDVKAKDLLLNPLFGRCSKLEDNIYLDVGHNILAAKEIAKFFQGKKVIIIYNSYKDKDYLSILKELKPVIKKVIYLPLQGDRVVPKLEIVKALKALDIEYEDLDSLSQNETYLVFGSFLCVESFLKFWESSER